MLLVMCSVLLVTLSAVGQITHKKRAGRIEKVYVDDQGRVHVVVSGADILPPVEKDQVQASAPKVAEDGQTGGWLVQSDTCCTSYPIPLTLVLYRGGKIIHRILPGQSIWDWGFRDAGRRVAFYVGPLHGDFIPHFELHDVQSGRLLAEWDGHISEPHPAWVTGLEEE